ncbi:lipid-A-disaccharide synthase [Phormidesmis priestleyi]
MRDERLGMGKSGSRGASEPIQNLSVKTQRSKLRIFISTGEVSGDLQGALLIEALQKRAKAIGLELEVLALGGDRMSEAGATLLGHTSTIGSVGILESVPYVLPTLRVQRQAKQYLQQNPPDLVVLIDYMGPNVAFCSYLHKNLPDVPVVFFIAPQEWVWSLNSFNTDRIIEATQKILAIFPAEADYYRRKGGQVSLVGHPLVDRVQAAPSRDSARSALGIPPDQTAIVLLPASRQQELKYLMPVMFEAARQIQNQRSDVHFWIPLALEKYRAAIVQAIQKYGLRATLLENNQGQTTLQAIAAADLAITKSGTVNLEMALLNVPQVVIYRVNPITAWIAQHILKFSIPFVSPPNLVEMKAVVPEFLQDQATPENIVQASIDLLKPENRQKMLTAYQEMQTAIGQAGVCDRAADEILKLVVN